MRTALMIALVGSATDPVAGTIRDSAPLASAVSPAPVGQSSCREWRL